MPRNILPNIQGQEETGTGEWHTDHGSGGWDTSNLCNGTHNNHWSTVDALLIHTLNDDNFVPGDWDSHHGSDILGLCNVPRNTERNNLWEPLWNNLLVGTLGFAGSVRNLAFPVEVGPLACSLLGSTEHLDGVVALLEETLHFGVLGAPVPPRRTLANEDQQFLLSNMPNGAG